VRQQPRFPPGSLQGLLEPVAWKSGMAGSEGAGAQQCAPATRLYFVSLDQGSGTLAGLRMVALQSRKMRLHHASRADSTRMQTILDQVSRPFATRVDLASIRGPVADRAVW